MIKRIGKAIYRSILKWAYASSRSLARIPRSSKALLLLRTDAIGDFVLFTPALRHLRQFYHSYKISLFVNEQALDLAAVCPYVDEVISCNVKRYRRNFFYRVSLIRKLRQRAFDIAVYSAYSRTPEGDEILYCSGAAEKIGFDGDLNNISRVLKAKNNRHFTQLVNGGEKIALEIDQNRHFVEQLLGERIGQPDFVPELWLSGADRSSALNLMEAEGLRPDEDLLIAMFPGALWRGKTWPADNYAYLADRLMATYKAKILVCGSNEDAPLALAVAALMRVKPIVLAGRTRLRKLAALLELCALCIGNDTGPLHIAMAVGTPTLCIMGGGHFGRFYPYGDLGKHRMVFKKMGCYHCNWRCIYKTTRCIQEISTDEVWQEAQQLVEEVVLPQGLAWVADKRDSTELR